MSFTAPRCGALEYLTTDLLDAPHGFSTRHGGVSTGVLESLNLGVHRGDRPRHVWENYRRFGNAVGFDPKKLVFTHQTHTDIVRVVTDQDCGQGLVYPVEDPCDALITNVSGVALTVFSADCTPILLHDTKTGAVGAVHSGWRGTALGIVKKTVEAMTAQYGTDPAHLRAAIGPCIGPCCFETDRNVPDAMLAALGVDALDAIDVRGEKYHVDLKRINETWLRLAGVSQIDICSDCTCCQPQRFWTHRKVGNARGSLASVIVCP